VKISSRSFDFHKSSIEHSCFFYPELSSRNHFISLLYEVELASEAAIPRCTNLSAPKHGEYAFFRTAPENLLEPHEIYRKFL
jgi:hypothetical protein